MGVIQSYTQPYPRPGAPPAPPPRRRASARALATRSPRRARGGASEPPEYKGGGGGGGVSYTYEGLRLRVLSSLLPELPASRFHPS
jgi:hypothetical protein